MHGYAIRVRKPCGITEKPVIRKKTYKSKEPKFNKTGLKSFDVSTDLQPVQRQ